MYTEKNVKYMERIGFVLFILATLALVAALSFPDIAQQTVKPKSMPQLKQLETKPQPEEKKLPEEPLVPQGKEADITIFFTGDVIGYIEECG